MQYPKAQENEFVGGKRLFQRYRFETGLVKDLAGLFPSNHVLMVFEKPYESNTSFFYEGELSHRQVNVAIVNANTLKIVRWLNSTDLIHVDFVCRHFNSIGVENITQAVLFASDL